MRMPKHVEGNTETDAAATVDEEKKRKIPSVGLAFPSSSLIFSIT